jgi:hypothetical protein
MDAAAFGQPVDVQQVLGKRRAVLIRPMRSVPPAMNASRGVPGMGRDSRR